MPGLCQFRFSNDSFHVEIETFDSNAFFRHWKQLQDANLRWESLFSSLGCKIVRDCKHKLIDIPIDNIEWASLIELPNCSTFVPLLGSNETQRIDRDCTRVFVIVYVGPIQQSVEKYYCLLDADPKDRIDDDQVTANPQLIVFVDFVSDNFLQDNRSQCRDCLFIGKVASFNELNPCPHPLWLCFHLDKCNNKFWTIDMSNEDDYDHRFHFYASCLSDEWLICPKTHPGNFQTLRTLLKSWQQWIMKKTNRETFAFSSSECDSYNDRDAITDKFGFTDKVGFPDEIDTTDDVGFTDIVFRSEEEFRLCSDDMVMCIFEFLPLEYVLCKASQVCRQWNRISQHPKWERRAKEYFEDNQLPESWHRIIALCTFGPGWWTNYLLQIYSRNQLYQAIVSLPDDDSLCVELCIDSTTTQSKYHMLCSDQKLEMLHNELVSYLLIYPAIVVLSLNTFSDTMGKLWTADTVLDKPCWAEFTFPTSALLGELPVKVTFICLKQREEDETTNISLATLRQVVLELDSLWI